MDLRNSIATIREEEVKLMQRSHQMQAQLKTCPLPNEPCGEREAKGKVRSTHIMNLAQKFLMTFLVMDEVKSLDYAISFLKLTQNLEQKKSGKGKTEQKPYTAILFSRTTIPAAKGHQLGASL